MNEETQTMNEELDDEYDVDLSDLDLSEDSGNQTDEQQEEQEEKPDEGRITTKASRKNSKTPRQKRLN